MPLYRVQSKRRLDPLSNIGLLRNPNMERVRRPRDIAYAAHEIADQWFFESFGVRYRTAALFCSGSKESVTGYLNSQSALVELSPLGEFSLCYSPAVKDLYGHLQFQDRMSTDKLHLIPLELASLGYINLISCGIEEAASSGCEVMIYAEYFRYTICQT